MKTGIPKIKFFHFRMLFLRKIFSQKAKVIKLLTSFVRQDNFLTLSFLDFTKSIKVVQKLIFRIPHMLLVVIISFLLVGSNQVLSVSVENSIVVTQVKVVPQEKISIAEIVLNDKIKIKEIEVIKKDNQTKIKFPEYVSKRKKIYPQVKILTKQAKNTIEKAIKTGKATEKSSVALLKWKITKFSLYQSFSSAIKVFCSVVFNNAIQIECRIMEGKYGPWIAWPARKDEDSGEWIKQILFKRKLKKEIEKVLLERYKTVEEEAREGWE